MDHGRNVTIVSHTHWDRAWYVTFQEFRARLVRLIDRLLKLLAENPAYRVFMLDGQMAVLEDYLEVRPQRQAELELLCKTGRLKVGPWYVLADEFLVSPEALIRNLQLGFAMGESYGGVSKIGYVPDGFGHIAQLPQILRGFGIDNAFFWRGLGAEGERLGTEFIWKAPDGSAVTTIWMPFGYHNISNLGYPIHWGDTSQMEFDPDLALSQISKAVEALQPMTHIDTLLLMNGIDHEEPEPRLPEVVALANTRLRGYHFTHGDLLEYLARVRQSAAQLPEFSGEFRWGKYSEILQGVYATRIYLKQINQRVETLYEKYAEPLAALAWLSGADAPEGTQDLLWTGWRWLLKNHPHDDIYGSGIDEVHAEMLYRFDQAEQVGRIIARDSIRQIASQINFTTQEGIPLLVFNPLGWERRETVIGEVDFDFDDPLASNFQMVDGFGAVVPCQVLGDETIFWMETLKANRKRRVRLAFPALAPACGFAAYYVQPGPPEAAGGALPIPEILAAPGKVDREWAVYPAGAENCYLSFQIAPDGGLTVWDKASGAVYTDLAHFEDVEDAGDEYSACPFQDSQPLTTRDQPAGIRLLNSGPSQVVFEIARAWNIPASLSDDRQSRSENWLRMPLTTRVTLYRDQPGLFFETDVDNPARDHKLSVIFPTDLRPTQVYVDGAFAVLPRAIDLPDSTGWVEDPTPLMHQRAFTDLSQDGRGLAIFNRGLPAVEVTRQESGARLAITLLRCVGWLSRDDLWTRRVAAGPLVPTPGAQCLGISHFEYAIFPHAGDWHAVYQSAHGYNAPLFLTRADTHEGLDLREMNITRDDPAQIKTVPWQRGGHIPDRVSFVQADAPELVLSSLHRTRDGTGLVARFYNIGSTTIDSRISYYPPLMNAWLVNLKEERLAELAVQDAQVVSINVSPHQVVTLELQPQLLN